MIVPYEPSGDENPHPHYMRLALAEARRALEEGEVPIGAVIARREQIVAAAHNQREQLADPTAHAEMIAITQAAQAVGGDIRGQQSAAILIVSGEKQDQSWKGVLMELRVEDHPAPVAELRRLIKVHKAYEHMNAGDLAVEHGDNEGALKEYGAAETLFPDNLEMKFWHAVALVNMGRLKGSYPLFRTIFALDENWRTLLPRLVGSELIEQKDVDTILRKVR